MKAVDTRKTDYKRVHRSSHGDKKMEVMKRPHQTSAIVRDGVFNRDPAK
jgi:hypothetical protein